MAAFLRRLLAHPLGASFDLDDPATTHLRRRIIASKPFLRAIYDEWYTLMARALPPGDGDALELGSGAGYCAQFIPRLITSEIFPCPGVQIVVDAAQLPFAANSLRAIVMTNVLHHLSDVRMFFREAVRCLRPGGKILMIEPWMTPWSRLVYRYLHHEAVDWDTTDWNFPSSGPVSGANIALPWIVFERDRESFTAEFPQLTLEVLRTFLPFRYILSGGVGQRGLMPKFAHGAWAAFERSLESQMSRLGMFAMISIQKSVRSSPPC